MFRLHFRRVMWVALFLTSVECVPAGQEPAATFPARPTVKDANTAKTADGLSPAAIAASKQDPAAVERGGKTFATYCAGCHGAAAKGGPGAPNLVRSLLVLDDEKGILIAPVIREGRPDKGMPKLPLSEGQISDIVAWLHVRTYQAGHRTTYVFKDVLTGDPKRGEAYFNGPGGCSSCHSASKDLAGIGKKYDPLALQARWIYPRSARRGGSAADAAKLAPKVTVTLASGEKISGTLDRMDDFAVSLRDSENRFHSFERNGDSPKIEIDDPLQKHSEMLGKYSDNDIHNMTAYLASLK
ncbi:MAG: c-type cytochrome [Bryobacteraceae bacterium]